MTQTLDNTIGAMFLGCVGSAFLYGFTCLQTFWYYHRWSRDHALHKYSVGILWLLDTVHLAFVIHAVYTYAITEFGNIQAIEVFLWSMKAQIAINVIVVLMVQSLYSYRVWILGGYHRGFLGYLVVTLMVAGFVVGIILAVKVCLLHHYTDLPNISWSINTSLATSTATDFLIAGTMCFYLLKSRSNHSRYLNSRISRLIQFTLSSGLFTSACSLSSMFCYILMPANFIFLGIQFVMTKLYIGSFFAMLNARDRVDGGNSSKYEQEASKGTPLRVHLHTTSYTTSPVTPTAPPSAITKACCSHMLHIHKTNDPQGSNQPEFSKDIPMGVKATPYLCRKYRHDGRKDTQANPVSPNQCILL